MRSRIEVPYAGKLDWRALQEHETFLFRRMGDRDEAVLGVGVKAAFRWEEGVTGVGAFRGLKDFILDRNDWAFGHLAYDLKNEVEALTSRHPEEIGFPLASWFVPRFVVVFSGSSATLHVHEEDRGAGEIWLQRLTTPTAAPATTGFGIWRNRTDRQRYRDKTARIMAHIQRGDIYELNYCMERSAERKGWDPFGAFAALLLHLDPPHAAFYRTGDRFALCASPERFLRFEQGRVLAQPMKGTRPRAADPELDRALASELSTDAKERSENIMTVDVMRNDLSRVAASRSVEVEELCAVKSYPAVHQLVSSVSAGLRQGLHVVDAIEAAWPMASMTGAPKVSAMRLIDEMEDQRRGLYSGSLGFFAPDGTADLNVVIRTILYDAETGRASLTTGSALTAACDPEKEWEECGLKARSVLDALGDA